MRCRRLTLLIALFVTLDLTNPFIGRAFSFNAEESMDGISRQHERHVRQAAVGVLPTPSGGDSPGLTRSELRAPLSRSLSEWFGQLRQAHAPRSEPQSATEDH
jgi:hypothetical protein